MLDIGAPAMHYPVEEFALAACIILLALLIFILVKVRKSKSNDRKDNSLLALFVAALLVPSVIFLGLYEEPNRFPPADTLDIQITLTNSSQDIWMGDIWIAVDYTRATIDTWENTTGIYGLVPGNFYEITFTCNGTAVFDGLDSVTLNFYYKWDRTMAYYTNASGNLTTVLPSEEDPYAMSLAFSHDGAWVKFDIWASEVCY